MSALDELKKKNPINMTMLEFVVTQAEYSEVTGNAELAAQELFDKDAELLALRERVAKLETKANEFVNVLTDGEIEIAREAWGNTNTRLVSERRRALEAALKSQ